MNDVIRKNRKVCENMEWITKEDWESSGDFYGLPDFCFGFIDEPLTNDISYSDILVFLANKYNCKDYLEIGVSVLKNFYQMACNTDANLIAFDINPKNPCIQIPRDFKYIKGNVLEKDDWTPLKELNVKHDLIFSDALHSNEGLQAEWDNYIKDHIADKFFIVWDDAWDNPTNYIKKNFIPQLKEKYGDLFIQHLVVQEWVKGRKHPILIVSNIKFNLD